MPERYGNRRRRDPEPAADTGTMLDPRSRVNLPTTLEPIGTQKALGGAGWIDDYMTSVLRDQPEIYLPLGLITTVGYNNWVSTAIFGQAVSVSRGDTADFTLVDGLVPNQSYLVKNESGAADGNRAYQSRDPVASDGADNLNFSAAITALSSVKGFSMECVMKWRTDGSYPAPSAGTQFIFHSNNASSQLFRWGWEAGTRNAWHIVIDLTSGQLELNTTGGAAAFENVVKHVVFRFHTSHWIDLWVNGVRDAVTYLAVGTEHVTQGTIGDNAGLFRQRNTASNYYYGVLQHFAMYRYAIPESSIVQRARIVSGLTVPSLALI